MKKKTGRRLAAAVLFCALALCGCTTPWYDARNVEDLLDAPQTDSGVAEMRAVLEQALGEEIQLKYPRGGDNLSPFLMADLDSNGRREAVLFYAVPAAGAGVRLAVLKTDNAGKYTLAWQGEGTGTDIGGVYTLSLGRSWANCLVVGYTNINISDKYAVVYRWGQDGFVEEYAQAYSQMAPCDMTGDGWSDILFASASTKPGAVQLSLVAAGSGGLSAVGTLELAEGLYDCTLLQSGVRGGRIVAVADCAFGAGRQASAAVCWQGGALTPCPFPPEEGGTEESPEGAPAPEGEEAPPPVPEALAFALATARPGGLFASADIDGDGALEVPGGGEAFPGDTGGRFLRLAWYRPGVGDTPRAGVAVADTAYGFNLLLPDALADAVTVEPGFEGSWRVLSADGTALLSVVLVGMGEGRIPDENNYTQVAAVSGFRVLLKEETLPDNISRGSLIAGFSVLE